MRTETTRKINNATFWLVVVAICFGIAQLLLMDISRYLAWDEAVYFAELNPRVDGIGMYAHRARGMTLIAAPVALISESMPLLRTYLVTLSSLGLFGAFYAWSNTISWAAPVSAALFSSTWLALSHGSELIPNYFSGVFAVAAIGLAVTYFDTPRAPLLVLAPGAVCLATLVRPLDGGVLVFVIAISSVAFTNSKKVGLIFGSATGALVGGLPWIVEAFFRFGGPIQRLELTREVVGGGLTNNVGTYLEMLAGPLRFGELAATPELSALWLFVLFAFSVAGLVATKGPVRRAAVLALVTSGLLAAPYLFYTEAAAPRFMIPALAFVSLSSGIGVFGIFKVGRIRALTVGAALGLGAIVTVNSAIAIQWSTFQSEVRNASPLLGQALAEQNSHGSCFFLSTYGYPQISVASRCNGGRLTSDSIENVQRLQEAQTDGHDAYALVANERPTELLDDRWECAKIPELRDTYWYLCKPRT